MVINIDLIRRRFGRSIGLREEVNGFPHGGCDRNCTDRRQGQALAQYYPPHQAYPRQPLPPAVNADELPSLNAPAVQDHPLPPVGVGPAYQPLSGAPYEQGIAAPPADAVPLPPVGSPGYQPQDCGPAAANPYGLRGAIPPGPPGSARQDAIREEAIRSQLRNSPVKSVRHQQEPDRCKAATRVTGLRCRPRCGPRAGRGRNWHPSSHAHKLSHQGTGGRGLLSIRRTPTSISCSATVKHCAMG